MPFVYMRVSSLLINFLSSVNMDTLNWGNGNKPSKLEGELTIMRVFANSHWCIIGSIQLLLINYDKEFEQVQSEW